MKSNPLTQQVNFIVSVIFLGSAALLAIVLILEASDMENPIATHMARVMVYQNL